MSENPSSDKNTENNPGANSGTETLLKASPSSSSSLTKKSDADSSASSSDKSIAPKASSSSSSSSKTTVTVKTSRKGGRKGKKGKQTIAIGHVYIYASFNNTTISITDTRGNVVAWSTAGKSFRGARKGTPFAAGAAAKEAALKAKELVGMKVIEEINIKGPGAGREAAIREIGMNFADVFYIHDRTTIPHNGCRPPKQRRV